MIDNIVLFTHPQFVTSASMPRFSEMISKYLNECGIPNELWSPSPLVSKFVTTESLVKWLGYIDQYVFFPLQTRWKLRNCSPNTLFVFCDQALGPWVPLVADRPHVIHCHDFMALKSSLGEIPENPTSLTGKIYQRYIRWGFEKGKNFISASKKTQNDLHDYSRVQPYISEVIYNGLNYSYKRQNKKLAFKNIHAEGILDEDSGCLLHVGGGQWYKNTVGVVKLYVEYCRLEKHPKPLIMVSPSPKNNVLKEVDRIPENGVIHFIQGLHVSILESLYSYADVFLFPSLSEGFGWPIIEAQACGCLVITTNDAPMNEIGGPAAIYLDKYTEINAQRWVEDGASKMINILRLNATQKECIIGKSMDWAGSFNSKRTLSDYLNVYMSASNIE